MKIGDTVVVRDNSYAVRVDKYVGLYSRTGERGEKFTILNIMDDGRMLHYAEKFSMHDIIIKSKTTGNIFLHSSPFVDVVENICPCCNRAL